MSQAKRRGRSRGQSSRRVENEDPELGSLNYASTNATRQTPIENGKSKFDEACARMQKSVKQFASAGDQYESSSDEEENENQDVILQQIMSSYAGEDRNKKLSLHDFGRTQQFIVDSFKSGSSVCLVCIATIKKTEAIWNCEFCYGIFHIPCIQKWAKESIFHQEQALHEETVRTNNITWFCPKCRHEYAQSEKPVKYFCFCGKTVNPKYDPWMVPHSCGEKCGKSLKPECGHFCTLLCHPGPCPPCPKTINVSCYCGRQPAQLKRCSACNWSCGQPCDNILTCGQHKCKSPCHTGQCQPCDKRSVQLCCCGSQKEERPCSEPVWQCSNVCGRQLECGHHTCQVICHSGPCDPCPKTGERTCPCGKTKHVLPCTEDIPSCGDTCSKMLECNLHTCAKRCHVGPCGICLQSSTKRCICGHREKLLPCHKEFRCEIKCKRLRDCGRHLCNRKCCKGQCPPCEQSCSRTLTCRNHKCSSQCHIGLCYPCPLTVDIKCNCGSTFLTVPCGRERVTKPPRCNELCKKPPDCHHNSRSTHTCHFGPCPPCNQICNKKLANCKHICPMRCHSAVTVKIQNEKKREGPWEPTPQPTIQVVNKSCPPCKVPIPVTCYGLHETTDFPCSEAKPFSCLRECGRTLTCTNHSCSLPCHQISNVTNENKLAGQECEECERPCSKPRPDGCPHECLSMCHSDACKPCKQMIKLRCHCQLNTVFIECNKLTSAGEEGKAKLRSCNNQCPKNISCGHRCPQDCHAGECPVPKNCKKKVALRCPCKRIKKDVACHLTKTMKIECDEKCRELKNAELKAKEEEAKRRQEEEKKKAAAELQKFQQKMEGKKRRQRKTKEAVDKPSIFENFVFQISAALFIIALAVIGMYVLY